MRRHSPTVCCRETVTTGAAHDVGDRRLFGGVALEDDLARVVALGDDPEQFAALHDQQRADTFFGHDLDGLVHGGIGRDR